MSNHLRFAIIVSELNSKITTTLKDNAHQQLLKKGILEENIHCMMVPGAVEIPLAAQWAARSKQYHSIICLGAIIRGETDHYHYVSSQVSHGIQTVMLQNDIPVIFGILTTNTYEQALDRATGKNGNKGQYAANAAIQMAKLKIATRSLMASDAAFATNAI